MKLKTEILPLFKKKKKKKRLGCCKSIRDLAFKGNEQIDLVLRFASVEGSGGTVALER